MFHRSNYSHTLIYLHDCLGAEIEKYNITIDQDKNYTHIEPVELRTTYIESTDFPIYQCLGEIIFPYNVIGLCRIKFMLMKAGRIKMVTPALMISVN